MWLEVNVWIKKKSSTNIYTIQLVPQLCNQWRQGGGGEKNIPSLLGIQNVNLFLHTAPAQWLVVIKVDLARLNSLYLSSNSSHLLTSSI